MNSVLLDFHSNLASSREVFLLNFRDELNSFEQTNLALLNLIRVVGTFRDLEGNSHAGLLPFLMLMSRQGLNAFEAVSTYRSYQAWVLLRPSLECALIMGKWFDSPSNAIIWGNRDKDRKTYQKEYSGESLLSKSLQGSKQIRGVLTSINDDFIHTNPRYYFRHTQTNDLDNGNILLQVRFNEPSIEHEAHLYAFLNLTRFLVSDLGKMFSGKFGERPEFNAALESMQKYYRPKVTNLIKTNPEARPVLTELGLWPDIYLKGDLTMPKTTVYYFKKYDINEGKELMSKRMATLETINRFEGTPLMDTAKEVDLSEVNENGEYPKTFRVIYSTKAFPILNIQQVGKQKEVEFSSFEAAKSAPFPTDKKYVFASIEVGNGWYTRSSDNNEWIFCEK